MTSRFALSFAAACVAALTGCEERVAAPASAAPAAAQSGAAPTTPVPTEKITGSGPVCMGGNCNGKDDPTAVAAAAPAGPGPVLALPGTKYGDGITQTESVAMSQLLAEPDKWVGKRVRVEGEVTDVCQMRGCWFEMAGATPTERMRFKVVDGVMTFPVSAKGGYAVAEGTVRKITLNLEQTKRALAHEAEETGRPFDAAKVTEPMTIVRLDGTGAVLREKK